MKKMLLATLTASLLAALLPACATPADQTSTGNAPAQWQQQRAQKGIDELDANTGK
jgi:outer membrane biogenesis lipoprotein LolB